MKVIKGKGVCGGIAFGKLKLIEKAEITIHRTHPENTENEILRFENAVTKASYCFITAPFLRPLSYVLLYIFQSKFTTSFL